MNAYDQFDIGDEITNLTHTRIGTVMDVMTSHTLMVLWEDEPFCRMVPVQNVTRPSYVTMVHHPKQRAALLGWVLFSLAAAVICTAILWLVVPA